MASAPFSWNTAPKAMFCEKLCINSEPAFRGVDNRPDVLIVGGI